MKTKKSRKVFINIILIFMILGSILWIIVEKIKENKIVDKEHFEHNTKILSTQDSLEIEEEENTIVTEIPKEYPKEEIIEEYKGYDVAAKLEIPQIDLETYILQNYSTKALNISVTKFWGVDANEIGNFCIAGHNFQKKNMFHNLKELEIGDKLTISDNKIGKIEYEIYEIYKVDPEDVSCLSQETNSNREVTLITCTNDSKKRIIVKAQEV